MTAKEKMTAPIASVGADVEQPSSNKLTNQSIADLPGKGNLQATNNAENTAKSANKKNPDDLETVSMMELYDTAYPPKLPIIDGLLYNGTYLFVGSPKIGKSFFMAQIGYHISKGLPLWGFTVRQGTVLYLALEDDYARLQKRLSQMFGMEGSENFYFATKSKSLNAGLEQQLVQFVTNHKDARLIIIDTLQKVREVGGDKFSYASDYEIVTKLKAFSDHYGICFLVVHHTRKMESSDSFDMISGTNGLLGASDGAFVMQKEKRTDDEHGKHVRTKKEILGEDGGIREGCSIVKKGEVDEKKLFTAKDERFKCNSFLDEVKHSYTDLINIYVQDEKQKLQVFERGSVYLATKKIGKNNPKAQEIEADNQKRREWNRAVDMALISGVPEPKIMEVKRKEITEPIRESIARRGNRPRLFFRVVTVAVEALEFLIASVLFKKPREKPDGNADPYVDQYDIEYLIDYIE